MKTITHVPAGIQWAPPHPGEILSGVWMEPLGLTVKAVADSLGVARKTVSKIVKGRAAVIPEMAIRLEVAFGASAASWLGHQAAFDLFHLERERRHLAEQVTPISMPNNRTDKVVTFVLRTEPIDVTSVAFKGKIGEYVIRAECGGVFRILRRGRPVAVLVPANVFASLQPRPDPLAKLRADFDELVARMQTPEHRAGVEALFAASGPELGEIAQRHARAAAPRKIKRK
jgi:addiction module HigA family antidote